MMRKKTLKVHCSCFSVLALATLCFSNASAVITNGDFETGDFTGWTLFETPKGSLGDIPGVPDVIPFDVDGDGVDSLAARFNVGDATRGTATGPEGGGILQDFISTAGDVTISAEVAAQHTFTSTNLGPGIFSLLVDGTLVDTVDLYEQFGSIEPGDTFRWTLSGTTALTAGNHELQVLIQRRFINTETTPVQFVDNVSVTAGPQTNRPPIVDCPSSLSGDCGTPITVEGWVFDPDGDPLTVVWNVNGENVSTNLLPRRQLPLLPPPPEPPPEPPSDRIPIFASAAGSTSVLPDGTVLSAPEATGGGVASVTDVIDTRDFDVGPLGSRPISYTAEDLPLGTNVVLVTASDGVNDPVGCTTLVIVSNTHPPTILEVVATPDVLWPPNKKLVHVDLHALLDEGCGAGTWKVYSVACSESDHDASDIRIGEQSVELRATRSGRGHEGRVYTIGIKARDEAGNESDSVYVEVVVPHDRRR
jgi:hypothetical protein